MNVSMPSQLVNLGDGKHVDPWEVQGVHPAQDEAGVVTGCFVILKGTTYESFNYIDLPGRDADIIAAKINEARLEPTHQH